MTDGVGGELPNQDRDPDGVELVPFRALDTTNRRSAALVYLIAAALAGSIVLAIRVDVMWITAVLPLVGIAAYQFVAGRHLQTSDMDAIQIASDAAPFDVGHASATMGFRGLTAKPVWQVLVFESGSAPQHQALVTIDALTGDVTGTYAEPVSAP